MPTLNWIGKEAVIHHHRDVPYRLWADASGGECLFSMPTERDFALIDRVIA